MKKFVLVSLLVASASAFAGNYGAIEYSNRAGVNGTADANAIKLTLGGDIAEGLKGDVSLRQKTDDATDNLKDTRLEAGLTAAGPSVGPFATYVRGAVGEKYTTSDDYTYYSVEPGVKYAVNQDLSVKAGYRFRNAFASGKNDLTRAYRLGAEYNLNKTYVLGLGVDQVRGDSDYNAVNVSLAVKF